jgi:hypothetical protein
MSNFSKLIMLDIVVSLESSNYQNVILFWRSFTPTGTAIGPIIDDKFCWILA